MPTPKQKAAEAKKLEAERLQGFLQEMLREEENKYCADCEGKQPRWASWNLGVFLCIRCAGLHRNLGVHISKVKSVTLDSWTQEQVQSMRVMGNAKARAVYECELPTIFRRPQTDQSLEQFIRAKYESKRYLMKGWVPPRIDVNDLPAFPETMARDKKAAALLAYNNGKRPAINNESAFDNKLKQSSPPITERAIVPELINFDFSAPANPTEDFLNTDINQQTDLFTIDDLFGPIVTAAPPLQQSIPASLSTPNLSNATNSSDFFSTGLFLTNNEPQNFKHQKVNQSNMNIDQKGGHTNTKHQSGIGTGFDLVSNLSTAANTDNPSQLLSNSSLIGSDLLGLDLSMCTLSNQSGNQIQTSQSSTMLSSPPATDIKKSTNEILALFNK